MRRQAAWLMLLWASLTVVASLQPLRIRPLAYGHGLHSVAHVVAFGVLAGLAVLCAKPGFRSFAVGACILLGALLESIQSALYGSAMEWSDLRDDALGAVVFSVLATIVLRVSCVPEDERRE